MINGRSFRILAISWLVLWSPNVVRPDSYVGCLFNDEVCDFDEYCFDDNAFGICQNERDSEADQYRHSLGKSTMNLLDKELGRLITGGYLWKHRYTQCVVQNILYSDRHGISYDPGLCSRVMQLTVPEVRPEALPDLESIDPEDLALIKFKPDRVGDNKDDVVYADETFVPPSEGERDLMVVDTPLADGGTPKKRSEDKVSEDGEQEDSERWDPDALFRRLLEVTKNVEEDFAARLPGNDLPVTKTELSSDLDHRPIFSEGGMDWVPVPEADPLPPEDPVIIKRVDTVLDPTVKFEFAFPKSSSEFRRRPVTVEFQERKARRPFKADDDDDDDNLPFEWNKNHIRRSGKVELSDDFGDDDIARIMNDPIAKQEFIHNGQYDAYLKRENLYPVFQRMMREDIKKPGPTFFLHDDYDGISYEERPEPKKPVKNDEVLENLMEQHRQAQMNSFLSHQAKLLNEPKPGYTEIQEDENLKELIHIQYSPQPSPKQGDNTSVSKDGEASVKRTYQDAPFNPVDTMQGAFTHRFTNPQNKEMVENGDKSNEGHYAYVDSTQAHLNLKEKDASLEDAGKLVKALEELLDLSTGTFSNVRLVDRKIIFKVNPNIKNLNATDVAIKAEDLVAELKKASGLTVETAGIGEEDVGLEPSPNDRTLFILTFILCGAVVGVSLVVAVAYIIRRHARSKEKLQNIAQPETEASQDYQDLCRQRMASKTNEGPETVHAGFSPKKMRSLSQGEGQVSSSSHSSTSSWNEEPVTSNMDISTGHMILAYMEDHLKKKDRLDREWEAMCAYEAEPCSTVAALLPQNVKKNRYPDVLPYDHSRVVLNELSNVSGSDYINANSITDHDPRNPAYIATQGPLPHTAADFWQMVWEQGSVVMVMLTRLMENGVAMCHRYWPEEGSEVYHIYEVHLVSEHMWCDIFLVRSFYLKNLRTGETRTVTQFHFLSWPDNGVPNSTKALLEFRRKVNKSYRGRSCPIVVHCSDGIGRAGTYILIDMVLNRMAKGAKEIDIAATLEHIRDQRVGMVKTKAQFEFVLMAIAEEVHAILKALSQ